MLMGVRPNLGNGGSGTRWSRRARTYCDGWTCSVVLTWRSASAAHGGEKAELPMIDGKERKVWLGRHWAAFGVVGLWEDYA